MSGTNKPLMGGAARRSRSAWSGSGSRAAAIQLIDQDGNLREATSYRAAYEDTSSRSRGASASVVEMVAANPGTDPWLPGEGTEVVLPTVHLLPDAPREDIVINLADMRLYYFGGFEQPAAVLSDRHRPGRPDHPARHHRGRAQEEGPDVASDRADAGGRPESWRKSCRPAGQPDGQPMYLGWPPTLIHGTNKPWGIGRRSSGGCIRMYPEHAEELFELVEVGTKVTVVDQPIKLEWIDGELFMEAHPTPERRDRGRGRFTPELPSQVVDEVLEVAGDQSSQLDWSRIRQVTVERRGYPIRITR